MKITRGKLRLLIREAIAQQQLAEEQPAVDLGRYVWPTANSDYEGLPRPLGEKDTPIEKKLFNQLYKHFSLSSYRIKDNEPPLDPESVDALKHILRAGLYSDVFKQCSRGTVYRGIRIPREWLITNAAQAIEAMPMEKPLEWQSVYEWNDMFPVDFTYTPTGGKYGEVSSWTGSQEEARRFAITRSSGTFNFLPCILRASCETGLFLRTASFAKYGKGLYFDEKGQQIKKLNPYGRSEKEVMLIGGCQVDGIQLFGLRSAVQ